MGTDALLQTFDAKLAVVSPLDLDDAVCEQEKEIARRKVGLRRLKRRVWNNAYRRPCGISANDHALYFAGSSTHVQRRWVTRARKARGARCDVDHAVEHRDEHQRAGLLQD